MDDQGTVQGHTPSRKVSTRTPRHLQEKKSTNSTIYKYLSHHYVLRRSICFIVDTEFSGIFYHDKANKYVKQVFESLHNEDYFGYISLARKPFPEQS